MNRSASLFASAILLGGLTVAGHAMAGQYSKTASELIIEHNVEASEPMVPGLHIAKPIDESNLDEMVETPAQIHQQQASAADSNTDGQVQVRDPSVPTNPDRTFQGWWKD
jgi:hypothetical protein